MTQTAPSPPTPQTPAEKTLLAGLPSGAAVTVGTGQRPDPAMPPDPAVQIRATFLRALLVAGGKRHAKGLQLAGAHITGVLDLQSCRLHHDLVLTDCHFDEAPIFRDCRLDNIMLDRSCLPGMQADRLRAEGSVYLIDVIAKGEICMSGARLGGDLDCTGALLTAGETGRALTISRTWIDGVFFLRGKTRINGILDMEAARMGSMIDAKTCWSHDAGIVLNRCRYGGFAGAAPVDAPARIGWLGRESLAEGETDFRPQPWEECARVLAKMGHGPAARAILIEKEKRQRKARRAALRKELLFEDADARAVTDRLLGATIAYGHKPLRTLWWLLGLWLLGAGLFQLAHDHGAIKPTSPAVLSSATWADCGAQAAYKGHGTQLACYRAQPRGRSYPGFNAFVYSADTLIPLVSLDMQRFWIPDAAAPSNWGWGARAFMWLQILAGWGLSLLTVAGFSGLIKSETQ